MKRLALLIFLLLLVVDLAQDGGFGKVTILDHNFIAKTSCSFLLHSCSGNVDCSHTLSADDGKESRQMHFPLVKLKIQPHLKLVLSTNNGSSGGIPLESALLQ